MKGECRERSGDILIFQGDTQMCPYGETTVLAHEPLPPRPSRPTERQTRNAAAKNLQDMLAETALNQV
jgi:hypothetical protein